jgi:hypothetical protein
VSQSTDDMVKWWRAFKRFMRDVEELREYFDDLCEERVGRGDPPRVPGDLEQDAEWCQELAAKCKAGFERFDRADNYEQDGDDVQHVLKVAPIAARLGVMMGGFMNPTTQSPELFGRAMVEQVADIHGLSMVALETACREIVKTEKWPDIPKIVDVVSKHVDEWRDRRRAVYGAERMRLELIPIVIEREQKKQQEARAREIKKAQFDLQNAIATTKRCAKEIEETKAAAKAAADAAEAKLAKLMQVHRAAEQRESECLRTLRKLTMTEEEQEAQAAAKANGTGCAELRLLPPSSLH